MSALFKLPKAVPVDSSGTPHGGAKASFFATGTVNVQNTYTTDARAVAHANPVVADSAGVFPPIYLDPALIYKLTLTESDNTLIYTVDPVDDSVPPFYEQTAAENTAGVTPTAFKYEPGDVRRYGAALDGTTDDTAALNAAISVSQEAENSVFLPKGGTLRITSTVIYDDAKPLIIMGGGSGGIELNDARIKVDTGGNIGLKNDEGGGQELFVMRDVGMYAATSSSAGHLLNLVNVHGSIIDNCRFSQSGNHGADCVHLEGVIYFTLRDIRVGRCRYGVFIGRDSVGGNASSGYVIDHLKSFADSTYAENLIRIEGGEGVIIQPDLSILGGAADTQETFGIYIKKDAAISEAGNILILHPDCESTGGASFQSGSRQIYVEDMAAVRIINPAITNSVANFAGIQFHDCVNCHIQGGWLDNDITFSGTSTGCTAKDIYQDTNGSFADTSSGRNRRINWWVASSSQRIDETHSMQFTWEEQDVPGTTAGQNLFLLGNADNREVVVPFDCYITGISIAANDTRTAGTCTAEPKKNDSATGVISAVLDATNTQFAFDTSFPGESANLTLAAGDRISTRIVTSSWTPTTADIVVTITVQQ